MVRKTNKSVLTSPPSATSGFLLWIDRHADALAYSILGLTALMALLLFNVRVSEGGDDSMYICRALDFLSDNRYPSPQGPLYPLFLSFFIHISGVVHLLPLKLLSFVCLIGGQVLMYFVLRRNISARLLLAVLLLMSVNVIFLQYASLTYSEALFYLLQWAVVGSLLRLDSSADRRRVFLWSSLAALGIILLALVRTVGFVWLGVALVFLLVRRRWFHAASAGIAALLVFGLWIGVRTLVWGEVKTDNTQLQSLMQVNPYDIDQGMETPAGYVGRFFGNANRYLSKHYCYSIGVKSPDDRETNVVLTFIVAAFFVYGSWWSFKRNRTLLLMALGAAAMLGATFISLQEIWDQSRLIIPYVAMMHFVVFYSLMGFVRKLMGKGNKPHVACVIIVGFMSMILFSHAVRSVDTKTLRANMTDDPLLGFTPDWYNYLGLCGYVGTELKSDSFYVACRKPDMARIYAGGKKFYGIFTIPSEDPDMLLDILRKRGVTHCIVGSLRLNPMENTGQVINTMHRFFGPIAKKYPNFLEAQCMAGTENNEPAVLYKLHYENVNADQ